MSSIIQIRTAQPSDAAALRALYAPYVEQTAITFEYEVPSEEEFATRIRTLRTVYPYLVAVVDDQIVGFAYGAPFRGRAAYQWDAELSIYLSPGFQGQRLGTRLYRALLALLARQNVVTAYACITVPGGSIAFHESLGFQKIGLFPRSGWKFESWHDVVWMEQSLRQRVTAPEPLIRFSELSEEVIEQVLDGKV